MWRPEEWDSKKIASTIKLDEYTILDPTDKDLELVEAGADAMLEALKKEGQIVNNDGSQLYGMVLVRSLKIGEKGYLVFIPDTK